VGFEPPGAGHWELDRSHYEGGITPTIATITVESITTAYRKLFKLLGVPADTLDVRIVNGFFYHRIRPLIAADKSSAKPPPAWVIGLVARIHPEFRRRNAAAQRTLDNKPWEAVVAEWNDEIRPRLTKKNLELQQVNLQALSEGQLADHLDEVLAHFGATSEEHHRLHGYDLGPIGELLIAGIEWGVAASEMLASLIGASPSTQDPARKLAAVRKAVTASDGSLDSLETIRASSPEAAQLVDDYIEQHGYLLYAGYDLTSPTLIERPEVLLASIRSAKDPIDVARLAATAADRVRDQLSPDDLAEFDVLLQSARAAMDMRDNNGPLTIQWPSGLTRLAMMEAGRRLSATGRIVEPEHVLELDMSEVSEIVRSGRGPSAELLTTRAAERLAMAQLDPPTTLGPPEPPPPLDALPRATARLLAIVNVLTNELLTTNSPDATSLANRVFTGTGIGAEPFVGIARMAATAEEAMAEMIPDEILVTRTTSPAYNLVLSMAGGLVTETGGAASHAAVLSRELDLPAVIGAAGCLQGIANGDRIEVDPSSGTVRVLD
jgi:phosphohistidine swiveling domain-containing protein